MGLAMGPMNHYWYLLLDGKLPGTTLATCAKKILLDQLACPVFSLTFITGRKAKKPANEVAKQYIPLNFRSRIDGRAKSSLSPTRVQTKIRPYLHGRCLVTLVGLIAELPCLFVSFQLDWTIWPPTQYINFSFLHPQYRVVYISSIQLFYNCIMSYIKHDVNNAIRKHQLIHGYSVLFSRKPIMVLMPLTTLSDLRHTNYISLSAIGTGSAVQLQLKLSSSA